MIIMPAVARSTSMGYSKRSIFSVFMKLTESTMATAEPNSVKTFMSRAKASMTSEPPKASSRPPPPAITSTTARPSTTIVAILMRSADFSRKTPSIKSAMAATTRKISGNAAVAWI
jgi:hypothetical protein